MKKINAFNTLISRLVRNRNPCQAILHAHCHLHKFISRQDQTLKKNYINHITALSARQKGNKKASRSLTLKTRSISWLSGYFKSRSRSIFEIFLSQKCLQFSSVIVKRNMHRNEKERDERLSGHFLHSQNCLRLFILDPHGTYCAHFQAIERIPY